MYVYVCVWYRINDALDLKKSKLTSVTLPASLPAIHEGSAFADLVLVSSEGTHMSCHRCVLVARSGERLVIMETPLQNRGPV